MGLNRSFGNLIDDDDNDDDDDDDDVGNHDDDVGNDDDDDDDDVKVGYQKDKISRDMLDKSVACQLGKGWM